MTWIFISYQNGLVLRQTTPGSLENVPILCLKRKIPNKSMGYSFAEGQDPSLLHSFYFLRKIVQFKKMSEILNIVMAYDSVHIASGVRLWKIQILVSFNFCLLNRCYDQNMIHITFIIREQKLD